MDIRNETDKALIANTVSLVKEERELLTKILHHLREIDRRRLYSSLQYKSLYHFTVKHLGYPEAQAYRRINAMKLLNELPELEEKISTGDISLTHLSLAQALFNGEKKVNNSELTHEQKLNVFDQIAKKSVREAEKITLSLSSSPTELKPDLMKAISADKCEFKFTATTSTKEKIEKLKGFLAHTSPNISLGELLEKLCDLGLKEWDPAKAPAALRKRCVKKTTSTAKKTASTREELELSATNEICKNEDAEALTKKTASPSGNSKNSDSKIGTSKASVSNDDDSKTITSKIKSKPDTSPVKKPSAAQTRRDVFARARSACENCGSTFALEIDHIHPKALGGSSDAENLRVLCKSCNQRAAIQVFGMTKMGEYLGGF
jgi:5-methylcytosine-specific restriction endonuclease McrA